MTSTPSDLARRAEDLYECRLKGSLEHSHPGQFVAIEPESGDYYLGRSLSEAIGAARRAHPDRLAYAVRVGQEPAIHIGRIES
jgi:hypothetical protein